MQDKKLQLSDIFHKNCGKAQDLSGVKTRDKSISMRVFILTNFVTRFSTYSLQDEKLEMSNIFSHELCEIRRFVRCKSAWQTHRHGIFRVIDLSLVFSPMVRRIKTGDVWYFHKFCVKSQDLSGVKTRDKSNNTKYFRIADLSRVFPTSIRKMKNKSWVKFSHKNCAEPYDLSRVFPTRI